MLSKSKTKPRQKARSRSSGKGPSAASRPVDLDDDALTTGPVPNARHEGSRRLGDDQRREYGQRHHVAYPAGHVAPSFLRALFRW
jgi:hypothetical protein